MNSFLVFDKNQKCTTGDYIFKELKKLNHNVKILYPEEVRSNLSPKPDLILAIDYGAHYIFEVDFHPKAIWLIDTHLTLNCDKIMAEFFDVVFVAQKNNFEKHKNRFSPTYRNRFIIYSTVQNIIISIINLKLTLLSNPPGIKPSHLIKRLVIHIQRAPLAGVHNL